MTVFTGVPLLRKPYAITLRVVSLSFQSSVFGHGVPKEELTAGAGKSRHSVRRLNEPGRSRAAQTHISHRVCYHRASRVIAFGSTCVTVEPSASSPGLSRGPRFPPLPRLVPGTSPGMTFFGAQARPAKGIAAKCYTPDMASGYPCETARLRLASGPSPHGNTID